MDPAGLPPPLAFGAAADLTETEEVLIFGYPFGEQLGRNISVNKSTVSSLRREKGQLAVVQLSGGLNPGNSGGPVANRAGQVIGVSVAKLRRAQGIDFAIPAERAEAFVRDQLRSGGRADVAARPPPPAPGPPPAAGGRPWTPPASGPRGSCPARSRRWSGS